MHRNVVRYFVAIVVSLLLAAGAFGFPGSPAKPSPAKPSPAKASPAKKVSRSGKKAPVAKRKRSRSKTRRRAYHRGRRRRAIRGQVAPTAQRVREIQQALTRSGHYHGKLTGKLDPATVAALADFQEAQCLARSGKLTAWTLKKLEWQGLPPNSRASAARSPRADP